MAEIEFPPIPKSRSKPIFSNVKQRAAKTEFRKALRSSLFALCGSLPERESQLRKLVTKFAGFIGPTDITRLPYISSDGKSKHEKKNECLTALLSWVIQQGWRFQRDEIKEEEAYEAIEKLTEVTNAGLGNCKVVGGPKGYKLEI